MVACLAVFTPVFRVTALDVFSGDLMGAWCDLMTTNWTAWCRAMNVPCCKAEILVHCTSNVALCSDQFGELQSRRRVSLIPYIIQACTQAYLHVSVGHKYTHLLRWPRR